MVAVAVIAALLISLAIAAASVVQLVRGSAFLSYDIALLTTPFLLWVGLSLSGLRTKSLANLVEPMAVFVFVCLLLGVRVFGRQGTPQQRSRWALASGLVVALLAYVLVPVLPE